MKNIYAHFKEWNARYDHLSWRKRFIFLWLLLGLGQLLGIYRDWLNWHVTPSNWFFSLAWFVFPPLLIFVTYLLDKTKLTSIAKNSLFFLSAFVILLLGDFVHNGINNPAVIILYLGLAALLTILLCFFVKLREI